MDLEMLKDFPRVKESSSADGRKLLLITQAWPFQRLMARIFDTLLFTGVTFIITGYLWNQLMTMVFFPKIMIDGVPKLQRVPYEIQLWAIPASIIAAFIISMIILWLVEPLLIHSSGGTPGKGLMNLVTLDFYGDPVKIGPAFKRTCQVVSKGLGFYIPVLSQILAYKAFKEIKGGKLLTAWDEKCKTVVLCIDPKKTAVKVVVGFAVCAAVIFVAYLIVSKLFGLSLNPMTDAEYEASRTTAQAIGALIKNAF